jgi:2-amino-4-hydroxy-6-hydroxymethyldihydropteridine diphosphokinase
LAHAIDRLAAVGMTILHCSDIIISRPIGPSSRQYANSVIVIESPLSPIQLLNQLKEIEVEFGIRRGQRWSQRVLDLDIILWSDGPFVSQHPDLAIPHPAMHLRDFVLGPAAQIAPYWRDPITGLTMKQLCFRQKRAKPLDRKPNPH